MAKRATGSAVRCLFCGRSAPDVKMTREHVLRKWFRQHMEDGSEVMDTTYQSMSRPDDQSLWTTTQRRVPQSPWEMQVREVCAKCNAGWLRVEVEEPIQDTLLALMRGQAAVLSPQDSQRVATWAAKTCVVRGAIDPDPRVIPASDARHIMDTLTPPMWTSVWLAHSDAPQNTTLTRHIRWTATPEGGPAQGCHATTFVLGEMVLHVLGAADPDGAAMIYAADWPAPLGASLTRLWPEPPAVTWPAHRQLTQPLVASLSEWVPKHLGSGPLLLG